MTADIQRWTTARAAPSEGGGFVAYGDYLALKRRLEAAHDRIAALEAKCALLAASLAQSEREVEERDERIAALSTVAPAIDAQPVAFEAWAAQYGFHAELIDVHQYAKEAARDAWQAGYAAALAQHTGESP